MIQLEQYRVFLAVAKTGSFSKAAASLYVTQPAVSQSMKLLEQELGAQLFVRGSRGVALTEAGEILCSYAEQALSLLTGAENKMRELKTLERGTLNIGASDTLCRHYLLPYLKIFHKKYPGVNLKVTNRTSRETVELLTAGKVDIGFINMPTALGEHIFVRHLQKLQDCFVYSKKHFPHLEQPVDLKTLQSCPLMMLEKESSSRKYVDDFFKEQNLVLTPEIELGSHDLLLSFAEIGLGVAGVVRQYAKESVESGKLSLVQLKEQIPPRSIALIYQDKIPLAFAAKKFIQLLFSNNSIENN